MLGLFIFLIVLLALFCWWRLVKAREKARFAATVACKQHGLVLMDDTVVLDSLDTREWRGKRLIGLRYRFEYAHNGILNKGGSVLISTARQALVVISTSEGQLIEVI